MGYTTRITSWVYCRRLAKGRADYSGVARAACRGHRRRVSPRFACALVLTASVAALHLALYFTVLETDNLGTGHYFLWLIQAFQAIVLWRGIQGRRERSPHHVMTYGQGVAHGVLISLYAGLMCGVFAFFHFKYINPHFADYQLACLRPTWSAAGLGAAQMADAEKMTRMAASPLAQAVITPVVMVCFGLIASLIIAAVLKRDLASMTSPPYQRT